MKSIFMLNLALISLIFPLKLFAAPQVKSSNFEDLKKKTLDGFVVPYVLRYNPNEWDYEIQSAGPCEKKVYSKNEQIVLNIWARKEETNLSEDFLTERFQNAIHTSFTDYAIEFQQSSHRRINGIDFLYHCAKAIQQHDARQIEEYVYSGNQGCVSLIFNSCWPLSTEEMAKIDELLKGFSFDGSACRGPAKLRTLKTIFEVVTDELSK